MELDMNYLKEKVAHHLKDILQYNNKQEDLRWIDIQIIGLCDTFELISHTQAAELREPVVRELEKLKNPYTNDII